MDELKLFFETNLGGTVLSALLMIATGIGASNIGGARFKWLRKGAAFIAAKFKRTPVLILFCVFGLFVASPAMADDGSTHPPVAGCNISGCSVYVFDWAWPNRIGFNGGEFVKVHLDVQWLGISFDGSGNLAGPVCLIPGMPSFLCAGSQE